MSTRFAPAPTSFVCLVAVLTALFAVVPRAYSADTYDIDVSGGKDVPYEYTDPGSGKKYNFIMQAWHRLLAFHTTLREQLGVAEGVDIQSADVGCVSKLCEGFEPVVPAGEEGGLAPYNPPASVTYRVYKTDWDRGRLKAVFQAAGASIEATESLAKGDFNVGAPYETPEESTCIPPYQPPCYDRPVCTLYGGCSRSSSTCVKCVK